jgi:hypothetical protein
MTMFLKPKKNGREPVMLATEDGDAGLVPASKAMDQAQSLADQTNQPVTIRDHISDTLIASLKPKKKTPQVAPLNGMSPLGVKSKKEQSAEAMKLSKGKKVTKLAPTAKELTEASSKLKGKKAAKAKSAKSKSDGQLKERALNASAWRFARMA